jgi:hypothetical protein
LAVFQRIYCCAVNFLMCLFCLDDDDDKATQSMWHTHFEAFSAEIRSRPVLEEANKIAFLKEDDLYWFGDWHLGKELFVRECYIKLAEKIVEIVNRGNFRDGVALIGTPGIGKSQFLAYLLWYVYWKMAETIDTFIITSVKFNQTLIMTRDGNIRGMAMNDFLSIGMYDEEKTLVLYDSECTRYPASVPTGFDCFMVAACSPSGNCASFVSQPHALTLYMPCWSAIELKTFCEESIYYCDYDKLDRLYDYVGGTVGFTLKGVQHVT